MHFKYIAFLMASATTVYSPSVIDKAAILYSWAFPLIAQLLKVNKCPVSDVLLSRFPAKFGTIY